MHGQEPDIILYHLTSLSGVGERDFFQQEGVLVWASNHGEGSRPIYWFSIVRVFSVWMATLLVTSVINIVIITVHFINLLLFPVNLFFCQCAIFTFCSSHSPLQCATERGEGEGQGARWSGAWSEESWGYHLNHNNQSSIYNQFFLRI